MNENNISQSEFNSNGKANEGGPEPTAAQTAKTLLAASVSFIPVKVDGTKAPCISKWKPYQKRLPTEDEAGGWFGGRSVRGIAMIMGGVSGNAELIDFDSPTLIPPYRAAVEAEAPGLLARLCQIETPRGGLHLIYRCSVIEGNQKLAQEEIPATEKDIENGTARKSRTGSGEMVVTKTMIETRGEGGYAVTVGSPPKCHELNRPYKLINGDLSTIPTITPEERELLLRIARQFSKMPPEETTTVTGPSSRTPGDVSRPGDDFNSSADAYATVAGTLAGKGWVKDHDDNLGSLWRRPGKDRGWSARLFSDGHLWSFSTNAAPFEAEHSYSPFAVYAYLEHGGDFKTAAKALGKMGFGIQLKGKSKSAPLKSAPMGVTPAQPVTPSQSAPIASASAVVATAAASLPDSPEAENAQGWDAELLRNGVGNPRRSYANTLLLVRRHPRWAGRWSRNEMANEPYLDGASLASGVVGDLISHCEEVLGFSPSTEYVERAINQAADDRPFHPVREYLRSLKPSTKKHLDTAAFDFWGTKEKLHGIYFRKWMISAVARAMQPGCKVDTALVLVGPQGIGKSSFWDVLGSPWFSDTEMDGGKDGLMQLHSAWIYEWGEIDRVTSVRAAEEVKGFLASREDTFRAPYARAPQTHPRSSVIVGSTNKTRFLNDSSGSRRFWIVPVTEKIPLEKLREVKDQLWAEAVAAFDANEQWWLTETEDAARDAAADEHQVEDSWTERAAEWAETQGGFTLAELLEKLGVEHGRQGKADQMRASAILERLGYERKKVREGLKTYYRWSRKESKK